jgi:hypothetical protein
MFKLLSWFNPSNVFHSDFLNLWTFAKVIFVLFLLYYLYKLNKSILNSKEWEILSFSVLIILTFMVSNTTWIYYGTFLVISYTLYLFVLEMNFTERLLYCFSVALLSFQEPIIFFSYRIGGVLAQFFYIMGPSTCAYILFFILTLKLLQKLHK